MSLGESSASDDRAVQATNDDATSCKKWAFQPIAAAEWHCFMLLSCCIVYRYGVMKGYWKDSFVKFFCKASEKKSPEISRGDS